MTNTTQSNVIYSNELFKQYLMKLSSGLIWKDTTEANKNESTNLVDLYLIELYVTANRGLLNFDIVKSFPRSVLLNANIPENDIEMCVADKTKIPENYREAVVKEYSKALSSINPDTGYPAYYQESNDYYRKLMGLPNKEDSDKIYNTDPRWNTSIPIHELTLVDRYEMENAGILDLLIAKYPDKEYIKYLGKKGINPFKARIADRFELLYYEETDSEPLNRDFMNVYNHARQMILSVYYNKAFNSSNGLYEKFLAMCILFITIQTMQHKYLKVDITRDFYDLESLKLIYDSYGVPFYNDIPIEYHRKIVKNINKLISYKGSSQVFFDLFNIFDMGSIDIYKYFLTKKHKMDTEGNPSFKTIKDANGNDILDNSENYIIEFSKSKIFDDPALSISDITNRVDYKLLTDNDPYWISDPELMKKLYEEDFNYIESKYIGIQAVFDLMKITYENAYIFRLITDNAELTDALRFRWADMGIECSLFDAFIYMAALYCREKGWFGLLNHTKPVFDEFGNPKYDEDGNLEVEPDPIHGIPSIMDTLGYNFEKTITEVRKSIQDNSYITNKSEILMLIDNIYLSDKDGIENVNISYDSIMKLRDMLIEGYLNSKNLNEYYAYRDLYKSLMISKEVERVYTRTRIDDDGNEVTEIYESYVDMLAATSPELTQRYLTLNDDTDLDEEMTIVIGQLEDLLDNLKYMSMSVGSGNSYLIDSLFKILTFFKSAKSELVGYDIIYIISTRGINFFKILDAMCIGEENGKIKNDNAEFSELIKLAFGMVSLIIDTSDDSIKKLIEKEKFNDKENITYIYHELLSLKSMLKSLLEIIEDRFKDQTWYIDFLHAAKNETRLSSEMLLKDIDNLQLLQLELLEPKYYGTIKDYISILNDKLRENHSGVNLSNIVDEILINDSLRTSINSALNRNNGLYTIIDNSSDDRLIYSTSDINIKSIIGSSESLTATILERIKDNIDPLEDALRRTESQHPIPEKDNQISIDIGISHNDYSIVEDSIFIDNLYEYKSNGELSPMN